MNYFAKVCHTKNQSRCTTRRLSSAQESDSAETSGRITVGKLDSKSISVKINIQPYQVHDPNIPNVQLFELARDTGVLKTILNQNDWEMIKNQCKFVKTSKRFQPFGTAYHLPIRGKAHVKLTAQKGAQIDAYVYIIDDPKEQSLLGEEDAKKLSIAILNPEGATHEVTLSGETVKHISYPTKAQNQYSNQDSLQDEKSAYISNTQTIIDHQMQQIVEQFPELFSNNARKFKGDPIKIHVKPNATRVVQPPQHIPLHCIDYLHDEIKKMVDEDIIEGPLKTEEPGTYISNLVVTDRKWDPKQIRVTLDCQQVNKDIY